MQTDVPDYEFGTPLNRSCRMHMERPSLESSILHETIWK
jgi:hypothetical protein